MELGTVKRATGKVVWVPDISEIQLVNFQSSDKLIQYPVYIL